MQRKAVYAGSKQSFPEAAKDLRELAGIELSAKQVLRITERIGAERVAERDREIERFQALPLVQRLSSPRAHVPQVAAVSMDGGRLQMAAAPHPPSPAKDVSGHWREFKAGCLLTLQSAAADHDPCPEVPATFWDRDRTSKLARDIHSARVPLPGEPYGSCPPLPPEAEDPPPTAAKAARPGAPRVLVRTVIASRRPAAQFVHHLRWAAWRRGFFAAGRKAFLGDGATGIWTIWQTYFSEFTPVLDFIHLLSYIYAAAHAGQTAEEGWRTFREWLTWAWRGQVAELLAALHRRQQDLGLPCAEAAEGTPARTLAETLRYVENHQAYMRYDEYRRQGLPLTTCHMESTVKQINQRLKGSEKFWSEDGAEALLQLRADHLSETHPLDDFWLRRQNSATGQRRYQRAA